MATISVDGTAISRAGAGLTAAGRDCCDDAAALVATLARLGAASGDPTVIAATLGAQRRWGEALTRCGLAVGSLGRALETTAGAYASTETHTTTSFAALSGSGS